MDEYIGGICCCCGGTKQQPNETLNGYFLCGQCEYDIQDAIDTEMEKSLDIDNDNDGLFIMEVTEKQIIDVLKPKNK